MELVNCNFEELDIGGGGEEGSSGGEVLRWKMLAILDGLVGVIHGMAGWAWSLPCSRDAKASPPFQ